MQKKIACLGLILIALGLNGCANSNDLDRKSKNQFITYFYANVVNIEKVKFKSYVGEGSAIGAIDGVLANSRGDSGDMVAGAIVGGLIGGLLTAAFEGSTSGYQYDIKAVDGDRVTLIVDRKAAKIGDCVFVRVAGDVRISKRPQSVCVAAAEEDSSL